MPNAVPLAALAACLAAAPSPGAAEEAGPARSPAASPHAHVRSPRTRAKKVDRERLTVRRIDVVDEQGVIRMTLAAPTPEPVIDGVQYRRVFPASGLVLFDRDGNERGGYVVADVEGTAVSAAQDHVNGDAVGWRVMPDGSVTFVLNERGPIVRDPALGGRIKPSRSSPTRIRLSVAADGAPSIALADGQDRTRLRLALTPEGYGAIEFLDADGKVVEVLAPEARARAPRAADRSP